MDYKKLHRERDERVRSMLDQSTMAESMLVMSMASDAQELLALGMVAEASELLNDIKCAVQISLGERDEQGRHSKTGRRFP